MDSEKRQLLLDQALEYEKRLKDLVEIEEGGDSPLVKLVSSQRVRNEIIEDYQDVWGKDLPRTIEHHLRTLKQRDVLVDRDDDEFTMAEIVNGNYKHTWLSLGLLSLGSLYFFAARAKSGKTDFMNYLVKCVTGKSSFLNKPITNGNVLWFHLEESKGSIQIKAKRHGFGDLYKRERKRGEITFVRTLDLVNDFSKLERYIEKTEPILVIIDTIRAAMARSGLEERNSNFADVFYRVQALAIAKNVTIVCLHHTNKKSSNGENSDPLDRVSGTSKLSGIGEGTIVLERDGNRTFLYYITRDIGRKKMEVRRKKGDDGFFEYVFMQEHGVEIDQKLCQDMIRYLLKRERTSHEQFFREFTTDIATHTALDSLMDGLLVDFDRIDGENYYFIPDNAKPMWRKALVELESTLRKEAVAEMQTVAEMDADTVDNYGEGMPVAIDVDAENVDEDENPETMRNNELKAHLKKIPAKYDRADVLYDGQEYLASVVEFETSPDNTLVYKYKLRNTKGFLPGVVSEHELNVRGVQELLQGDDEGTDLVSGESVLPDSNGRDGTQCDDQPEAT